MARLFFMRFTRDSPDMRAFHACSRARISPSFCRRCHTPLFFFLPTFEMLFACCLSLGATRALDVFSAKER